MNYCTATEVIGELDNAIDAARNSLPACAQKHLGGDIAKSRLTAILKKPDVDLKYVAGLDGSETNDENLPVANFNARRIVEDYVRRQLIAESITTLGKLMQLTRFNIECISTAFIDGLSFSEAVNLLQKDHSQLVAYVFAQTRVDLPIVQYVRELTQQQQRNR